MAKYGHIVAFKVDMHYISIRARLDTLWTWLSLAYQVEYEAIGKEISEWQPKWRPVEVGSDTVYPKKKKKKKKIKQGNVALSQQELATEEELRKQEAFTEEKARIKVEKEARKKAVEDTTCQHAEEKSLRKDQEENMS